MEQWKQERSENIYHVRWMDVEVGRMGSNRPFPLTSKYVPNPWRHIWGASEGLLGWIFHCIREHSLRSDGCCLRVQENPKLLRGWPRVQASAFSTVVVRTLCNFFQHCHGAVRWRCLVCIQRFVVAIECPLTCHKFWPSITYSVVHQPKVSVVQFQPM